MSSREVYRIEDIKVKNNTCPPFLASNTADAWRSFQGYLDTVPKHISKMDFVLVHIGYYDEDPEDHQFFKNIEPVAVQQEDL
jgi:hypothetical protein